jgi:hypothetical protein
MTVVVFQDDDRAPHRPRLVRQRRRDLVRLRARRHEILELAADVLRDVDERAERSWREQRIAGPPQQPLDRLAGGGEATQQCRLAAAGFAGQEDEDAAAGTECDGERVPQCREVIGALQQVRVGNGLGRGLPGNQFAPHRPTMTGRRRQVHSPVPDRIRDRNRGPRKMGNPSDVPGA